VDINAGILVDDKADQLMWFVELVQGDVNQPLFIDKPGPAVIKNAIPAYRKKPMINSITLESSRLEGRK
jgi:5-methyltetrahydrofolate--homocysteine methyltransferase